VSSFGKKAGAGMRTRRGARRQVDLTGSAVTVCGARSVLIQNLSPGGAKLIGRDLPKAGTELLMRTGQFDVLGRVAWTKSEACGVVFEEDGPSAGACFAMQMQTGAKSIT
jgi:PilZ domain